MLPFVGSGFLTILLAGIVQGTVLTPMPYLKKWSWENIWLVYSVFAYVILPWPFALVTVPNLVSVFGATPHEVIVRTLFFGFLWGLAVVLRSRDRYAGTGIGHRHNHGIGHFGRIASPSDRTAS